MFKNKILQLWKNCFFLLKLIHIFSLFPYSCSTNCIQIQIFRYHEHCPILCKNYDFVFMRKIMTWILYSCVILCNIFFKMNAQFLCKACFVLIQNECKILWKKFILCKNTKQLCMRIYCFVEILFKIFKVFNIVLQRQRD